MLITMQEMMDLTGLSRAKIKKKLEDAEIPMEMHPNSKILRSESKKALPVCFGLGEVTVKTQDSERTRLYSANADKAEMELEIMKGKLLYAEDVEREVNRMLGAFRAKIMNIKVKAPPMVLPLADINECEAVLGSLIYEALAELSDYDPEQYCSEGSKEVSEDAGATAKTNRKPVGRPKKKAVQGSKRRTRPVEH